MIKKTVSIFLSLVMLVQVMQLTFINAHAEDEALTIDREMFQAALGKMLSSNPDVKGIEIDKGKPIQTKLWPGNAIIQMKEEEPKEKYYISVDRKVFLYRDEGAKSLVICTNGDSRNILAPPDCSSIFTGVVESEIEGDVVRRVMVPQTVKYVNLRGLDTSQVENMSDMFKGFKELSFLLIDEFNTSNVKNMSGMFMGCQNLNSMNMKTWNFRSVEKLDYMFARCSAITRVTFPERVESLAKPQSMRSMFCDCSSLKNVNNLGIFDTSEVRDMSSMFQGCSSLNDPNIVVGFNTSKVTNMKGMFSGCKALESLTLSRKFIVSESADIGGMFTNCVKLKSVWCGSGFTLFDVFGSAKNAETAFEGLSDLEGLTDFNEKLKERLMKAKEELKKSQEDDLRKSQRALKRHKARLAVSQRNVEEGSKKDSDADFPITRSKSRGGDLGGLIKSQELILPAVILTNNFSLNFSEDLALNFYVETAEGATLDGEARVVLDCPDAENLRLEKKIKDLKKVKIEKFDEGRFSRKKIIEADCYEVAFSIPVSNVSSQVTLQVLDKDDNKLSEEFVTTFKSCLHEVATHKFREAMIAEDEEGNASKAQIAKKESEIARHIVVYGKSVNEYYRDLTARWLRKYKPEKAAIPTDSSVAGKSTGKKSEVKGLATGNPGEKNLVAGKPVSGKTEGKTSEAAAAAGPEGSSQTAQVPAEVKPTKEQIDFLQKFSRERENVAGEALFCGLTVYPSLILRVGFKGFAEWPGKVQSRDGAILKNLVSEKVSVDGCEITAVQDFECYTLATDVIRCVDADKYHIFEVGNKKVTESVFSYAKRKVTADPQAGVELKNMLLCMCEYHRLLMELQRIKSKG